jgi:hypothetical protein
MVLFLAVTACKEGAIASADVIAPEALFANGRSNGHVTVPLEIHATLTWVVDQSPAALVQCAPRPGVAVGSGSGNATHLGRFVVVTTDHCTVDLAAVPPLVDGSGSFEWESADGSTIHGSYVFLFLPADLGGFYTAHIEGGTGRFAGVTGQFDLDLDRTIISCVDALCLNGATFNMQASGWLTLPRP